jgi:hypothetical protein
VTDFLDPEYGDEEDGSGTRRHALWGLVVLACIAVLVALLMVFLGGGGHKNDQGLLDVPVQTPHTSATPTTQRTSTSAAHTSTAPSTPTSPTSPSAPRTGNPCRGGNSCIVDGDGGAIAAVNALRTAHGLSRVPGAVTKNAQTCALHNGGGSTCIPHYAWTSVPAQDGKKAIAKIEDFGEAWLLDAKMSTLSVGWAYVGGSYECVLLKSP